MRILRLLTGSRSRRWSCAVLVAAVCAADGGPSSAKDGDAGFLLGDKAGEKAEVALLMDQQMDFGVVADKNGSVTLGLADAITADPQFIHYGGAPYSAIVTVTGDPDTAVDVSISSVGANGLSLGNFVSSEGPIPLIAVNLDGTGELVLTIGATLTVDAAQASTGPGQSVSYTITTTYN